VARESVRFETRNQRDLTVERKTGGDGIKVGAYHGRHGSEGLAVGARDGDGIGGGGGIQTTRAATAGGVEVSTVGDGDSPTESDPLRSGAIQRQSYGTGSFSA
jgi:hypothetical protein